MGINVGFVEDSNVEKSERHIDIGVKSDVERSDLDLDKVESLASETNSD